MKREREMTKQETGDIAKELIDSLFAAKWGHELIRELFFEPGKQDAMYVSIEALHEKENQEVVRIIEDNPDWNWNITLDIVSRICKEHNNYQALIEALKEICRDEPEEDRGGHWRPALIHDEIQMAEIASKVLEAAGEKP